MRSVLTLLGLAAACSKDAGSLFGWTVDDLEVEVDSLKKRADSSDADIVALQSTISSLQKRIEGVEGDLTCSGTNNNNRKKFNLAQLELLLTPANAAQVLFPFLGFRTEIVLTSPLTSASKKRRTTTTGDCPELPMGKLLLSLPITTSNFTCQVCMRKTRSMALFTSPANRKSFSKQTMIFASSACILITS